MNLRRLPTSAFAAALLLTAAGAPDRAEAQREGYTYLSYAQPDVLLVSSAEDDVAARVNLPVLSGDSLVTGVGSRVEAVLADGNVVRVDGYTELRFDRMAHTYEADDDRDLLFLAHGTAAVEVRVLEHSELQVAAARDRALRFDTDDATILAASRGLFRVDAGRRGTEVYVLSGKVEVQGRGGRALVRAGEYAYGERRQRDRGRRVRITPRPVRALRRGAAGPDRPPRDDPLRLVGLHVRLRHGLLRRLRQLDIRLQVRLVLLEAARARRLDALRARVLAMDARGHDVGLRRAMGMAPISLRDVGLRRLSRMALGARRGVLARLGLLELHARVGGLVSDRVLLHVLPPRALSRRRPEPPRFTPTFAGTSRWARSTRGDGTTWRPGGSGSGSIRSATSSAGTA